MYAVGGHNGSKHLGSGEVFDPVTAKWKKIASMVTQKTGVYDMFGSNHFHYTPIITITVQCCILYRNNKSIGYTDWI